MLDLLEKKRLLDWQRGVRKAWDRVFLASVTQEVQPIVSMCKDGWVALRRAIEGDEPSEAERVVRYLRRVSEGEPAEPKEGT